MIEQTVITLPDISVVIPIYNEAENIFLLTEELTAVLPKLKKPWEVIFVDDGSTDASLRALEAVSDRWASVRVIGFENNRGQTAAFAAGFSRARGEIIITMDGDLQNDPADIPKLLEKIGTCDLVCGRRQKRNDGFVRRLSSRIANRIRNRFLGDGISDVGCSLKSFRREYVEKLKLYNGMHRFFPALVQMEGGRIVEIPVNHRPRKYGRAKYNIGNRAVRAFVDLLAVCWMKKRHLSLNIKEYY